MRSRPRSRRPGPGSARALLVAALFAAGAVMTSLAAQEVNAPSVFVESAPLGASLRVDGQIRAEKTPVLLRGLKAGNHEVQVFKEGYAAQTLSVSVGTDKVAVARVDLAPDSVIVAFPANAQLVTPASTNPTVGQQFRLPAGRYDLASDPQSARARPAFDDEALATLAPWLAGALFAAASVSTGLDWYASQNYQSTFQPGTFVLWGALAGDLLWTWALGERQSRFQKSRVPTFEPLNEKAEFAAPLAARAEAALQSGDVTQATALYGQLVREYPDAAEVPTAWFRLARLNALAGERAVARGEYRLLAETLQSSQWYDRAHKALADMDAVDGNLPEALYHLRQLTYVDGVFSKADIQSEIERLTKLASPEAAHAP